MPLRLATSSLSSAVRSGWGVRSLSALILALVLAVSGGLFGIVSGAQAETLTKTIALGGNPSAIVITPDGATAYVAVAGTPSSVAVIDVASGTVKSLIPVGDSAQSIAINAAGTTVYVGNSGSDTVSVINVATGLVTGTIGVGVGPEGVAVNAAGTWAYTANDDGTVSFIDLSSATSTTYSSGGLQPRNVVVSPDGTTLYVSNISSGTVTVLDAANGTLVKTIPGLSGAFGLALAPGGFLYVARSGVASIAVVDPSGVVATSSIPLPGSASGLALSSDGGTLTAALYTSDKVVAIDTGTRTVTSTTILTNGTGPHGVAQTPDGSHTLVANWTGASLSVIEADRVPTFASGAAPAGAIGQAYSFAVPATGAPAPTFAVTSGTLQAGLTLDPNSGVIKGTPTASGSSAFTVTASNVAGSVDAPYSIVVSAAPKILPATGADVGFTIVVGFSLLLLGVVLLVGSRISVSRARSRAWRLS